MLDLVRTQRTQSWAASAANELAFFLAWCRKEDIEPLRASVRDIEIYAASLAKIANTPRLERAERPCRARTRREIV